MTKKYNSYKKIENIYDVKIKKLEREISFLVGVLSSYDECRERFEALAREEAFIIYTQTGRFPEEI